MKAPHKAYSISEGDERIREILNATDQAFSECTEIPHPDRLTYDNGFYMDCAALFIDIRGSSKLVDVHTRPVLGKIYRAYISECVAVMNHDANCGEVFIQGDCVGGVFHTPIKAQLDSVFVRAAQLNSTIRHMNWRLSQRGYSELVCGIGLACGRALMIKAGYKGSGIKDVIWMGNVVNEAAKLCHQGRRGSRQVIQVSTAMYSSLNGHNKGLLSPVRDGLGLLFDSITHYEGDFVDPTMDEWSEDQREQARAQSTRLRESAQDGLFRLGLK